MYRKTIVHLNAPDQLVRCSPWQPTWTVEANPTCSLWDLTGCRLSAISGNNVRTIRKEGFEAISIHTCPRLTYTPNSSVVLQINSLGWLWSYINKEGNPFSMPPSITYTADAETDSKMPSFVEEANRFHFVLNGFFPIIPSWGGKVSFITGTCWLLSVTCNRWGQRLCLYLTASPKCFALPAPSKVLIESKN